jgi:hypothetical protein
MLPLLEYSAKKEQMLQEYYAQLRPQFDGCEPWEGAPAWAILTGEVEVLLRETTQLYVDVVRADEFHHYCAVTQPDYPYAETEHRLEELFAKLRTLLADELTFATVIETHGYCLHGKKNAVTCLREVELLLADESPVYTADAFQTLLQQSFDDMKAGRLAGMTTERL